METVGMLEIRERDVEIRVHISKCIDVNFFAWAVSPESHEMSLLRNICLHINKRNIKFMLFGICCKA